MKAIDWDGGTIARAGLYAQIPLDVYHEQLTEGPSLSKSGAWEIVSPDGSAAHYFSTSYLNPDRDPFEESEALILGRGAHHLLLGESDFHKGFAIRPEEYPARDGSIKPWSSNAQWCKEWLEERRQNRQTVLLPKHIAAIRGMSKTLAEHPMVRNGILNGLVEHTMVWRDVETGVWLKVRPDVVPTDDMDVSDLKTAASVSDRAIDAAIGNYGYALQGAMIGEACRHVLGVEMGSFSLVFVEKTPPYAARVVTVTPEDLELGQQQMRGAARMFAKCLERGRWPGPGGYQEDAVYASMTPFHRREAEYRLARLQQELESL